VTSPKSPIPSQTRTSSSTLSPQTSPTRGPHAQKILEAGGNAFDAATAVFYMTTVVEQHQARMGGDAFMVAYVADQDRVVFINGTGGAPALATFGKRHAPTLQCE
jgi:gamma-glutamyltranspeptidase/glutathione hydrolase